MQTSALTGREPALPTEAAQELVIGLVNLMPHSGAAGAAAQFKALLAAAASPASIRLRVFEPASDTTPTASNNRLCAEPLLALWVAHIDGLIVTGAEPQAGTMEGEPSWCNLKKLVDWAAGNTISAIWSCLAAHAAVWRMDGVARQPLTEKLSGVFDCKQFAAHEILPHSPSNLLVPHSRYNTLCLKILRDLGYTVLTSSKQTGPDMFTKTCGASQFVFFQGHPEYAGDQLAAEYSRDVKRFLGGHAASYPKPPECYFGPATLKALSAIEYEAKLKPHAHTQAALRHMLVNPPQATWREGAQRVFAGWLSFIAARKIERERLAA